MIDNKEAFNLFVADMKLAYGQFCLWRKLQNADYDSIYERNEIFWDAVLKGLFMSTLSNLLI